LGVGNHELISSHRKLLWPNTTDDAICHCGGAEEARELWRALADRFAACKLVLHPEKTKIVYCKDANRQGDFPVIAFDFLGYRVLQRHIERRAPCNENVSYSCVKDEGGPLGIGFQERVPNHSKRLRSKAVVVNVGAKARGMTPSRCVSGRRAKANPSMTRRKET